MGTKQLNQLTVQTVTDFMDTFYYFSFVDYNDNLNNSLDILSKCLEEKSADPLHEAVDRWYDDSRDEEIHRIIGILKAKCVDMGYEADEVDDFFFYNEDEIMDELYLRDKSDTERELILHTNDIPIRIEMYSNYDCINSHWCEDMYSYSKSYFGTMVDALNLNPSKVLQIFQEQDIKTVGNYPDKPERNGNELVSYSNFADEIANSISPVNLLTFIATISTQELYEADFNLAEITLPKGNICGLFSHCHGGGSLMDMKLLMDITLKLDADDYDFFSLSIDLDKNKGYSLKDVYGVVTSFFGKKAAFKKTA